MKIETVGNIGFTALNCNLASYAETASDFGINLDGTEPFSIDAWVNLDSIPNHAKLLSKQDAFSLGVTENSVFVEISGRIFILSDPEQNVIDCTCWHHVCITFDGSMLRIYIDGDFNYGEMIDSWQNNSNPFLIASEMEGYISSLRIYKKALDENAVKANMFPSSTNNDIVANFDFTQAPPVDIGPHHFAVTLKNGAMIVNAVPSLSLIGTAYASALADTDVNPGGTQVDPYTVQAWIYVTSTENPLQVIFANGDFEKPTGMSLYLQLDSSGERFYVVSQRGENIPENRLECSEELKMKEWYNVATVFDGRELSIFIDGILKVKTLFGPIPQISNHGTCLIGTGRSYGTSSAGTSLQGNISCIHVWTRALHINEIKVYMKDTPAVDSDGISAVYEFSTFPVWNLIDQHPVGLAAGAKISKQVSPASTGFIQYELNSPFEDLDSKTMNSLLHSVDITTTGFLTLHELKNERILLCHSPRLGTYVAYRGNIADYDDCTFWRIRLVYCLVSGAIDVVFGLRCKLSNRAINRILNILTTAKYTTYLARQITVQTVWLFLVALFQDGHLTGLVRDILFINSFFAILRVVIRIASYAAGYGVLSFLASLAITVVDFGITYSQRPATCDPPPQIDLAEITFNCGGSLVSALPIRRNYLYEITPPEWKKGATKPKDSLTAYSISSVTNATGAKIPITIKAKFMVNTNQSITARIKADGGGILGAISEQEITLQNGYSTANITLTNHTVGDNGVQLADIKWTWFYKLAGSSSWTRITESNHRIYVILDTPTLPWGIRRGSTDILPWADVLDYACSWANGTKTVLDAATKITQAVNKDITLTYQGGSNYINTYRGFSTFNCTNFIAFLQSGTGKGNKVNCTDCATIVSTFVNSLGCDLTQKRMYTLNAATMDLVPFYCNKIIAIGSTTWKFPFPGMPFPNNVSFSYHEVCWTNYDPKNSGEIFDACLKVDNSNNPWTDDVTDKVPLLPVNMKFTSNTATPIPIPFTENSYRERLAQNKDEGINRCILQNNNAYTFFGRRSLE
jgi:hypothetical protein